jgi:hypothetical protein
MCLPIRSVRIRHQRRDQSSIPDPPDYLIGRDTREGYRYRSGCGVNAPEAGGPAGYFFLGLKHLAEHNASGQIATGNRTIGHPVGFSEDCAPAYWTRQITHSEVTTAPDWCTSGD